MHIEFKDRIRVSKYIDDVDICKAQILKWTNSKYDKAILLDSNQYNRDKYKTFDFILALGVERELLCESEKGAFDELISFRKEVDDWLFGHFSYDLKNDTEEVYSRNFDGINFPSMYFFQPQKIFILKGNVLECLALKNVSVEEIENDFFQILNLNTETDTSVLQCEIEIKNRISKEAYIMAVKKLLEEIQKGNIYEVNFCQEFFAEEITIRPEDVFKSLNSISKAPFSCFYKFEDRFLICASPERFLKKTEDKIISQPIKGTAKRGDKYEDPLIIESLKNSLKEQTENIIVVDLVRNDLSHFAADNSVKVEELCGVYTFEQVHQLISTITAELKSDVSIENVIKKAFPMGSMTGAPKIKAMQLLEKYESTKRGIYSGSVGYITPGGDFDFNVVIRSILYNSTKKYVSFITGGAITSLSIPEEEYQECMLKAKAMIKVLSEYR
ncbi:anthranilate synthase component I family protein [Ichthyobacterium seriolicida]|uniref:Para-aminobenzoate synthase n=1 Tax=Ichthyobacterium seriolicida TaxID=242600 RepID=A0A1J1E3F3_9FLAO|nr:anthranilate synthase component I family protein [Ichthyobacterium seriolicida]BAV94572.1 para-aminobenzoate synthase [Ichthyobacterium seriolicida]